VLGVGLTLVVACIKNVYHNLIVHTTWGCSIRFSLPPCEVKSDMHLVWMNSNLSGLCYWTT